MKYIKEAALSIALAGSASVALASNWESQDMTDKDYTVDVDAAALEAMIENMQANGDGDLSARDVLKELGVNYVSPTSDPRYSSWGPEDFRSQMID